VPVQRLTTSALLARYRVGSLLVEKRREVFSLEILRRLGLGEAVHAVADGVSDMVVKPTLNSQTGADTTLGAAHRPRAGRSTAQ
jgi:putative polyketide hydroxylase